MDESMRSDILDGVADTVCMMYDGNGDLLDRIDEVLRAKKSAQKMGIPDEDIESAMRAGRQAFVNKANSMLGTNLKP